MRDYAQTFHTSVVDLERKRVIDFIYEYCEAVNDAKDRTKRIRAQGYSRRR